MASYLFIEARDPFDSGDSHHIYDLAGGLADNGDDVTVYLVQNGVLPTRAASNKAPLVSTLAGKATVLADDFSLRERGITSDELVSGVAASTVDDLVDLITDDGRKVIWH
jgi:sulfur transfer complex TusBCD TusB component (DsrH family)